MLTFEKPNDQTIAATVASLLRPTVTALSPRSRCASITVTAKACRTLVCLMSSCSPSQTKRLPAS